MEAVHYHVEDEMVLEMIDKKFYLVNVIDSHRESDIEGHKIAIHDPRSEERIMQLIKNIYSKRV